MSVGNAVVMGCHLLVWATIRHDLFAKCPAEEKNKFAVHLRQALVLNTVWKPMHDMKHAIFDSISTKQAAARRAKTSVLGLVSAYGIIVEKEAARRGQRKSKAELLLDMMRWHNKQEESRACRLQQVEMKAIQVLSTWSTGAKPELATPVMVGPVAAAEDRPQSSRVPARSPHPPIALTGGLCLHRPFKLEPASPRA